MFDIIKAPEQLPDISPSMIKGFIRSNIERLPRRNSPLACNQYAFGVLDTLDGIYSLDADVYFYIANWIDATWKIFSYERLVHATENRTRNNGEK